MNVIDKRKIELLAPAGNYECFIAAINAGADAVYLGMHKFGARSYADNFSEDELIEAIKIAHIYGKRIYLTVNTLFKESELDELYDFLKKSYTAGLDGVIVQDIGVVSYINKYFPKMEIHASTQMAITSISGVEFAKKMGICRVVPARELSLCEIKKIYDETGIEIECFIHGALCYSYSGKCLFSSCLGERSGNRGSCAGPCRLEYDDEYLLSMKDLYTLRLLPELIDAGIFSFKIEGRMKSPDYVYGVTSIYRKYIDEYFKSGKVSINKTDEDKLLSLYTRDGNCEGYYKQKNGRNMITIKSPAYSSMSDSKTDFSKILSKITITGKAKFCFNHEATLEVGILNNDYAYPDISVCVCSENKLEKSKKAPATVESIHRQLNKTGGTCFAFDSIDIELEPDLFISNGELNALRRNAIDALMNQIGVFFEREILVPYNLDDVISVKKDKRKEIGSNYDIKASVLFENQLDEIVNYNYISGVILSYSFASNLLKSNTLNSSLKLAVESNKSIYIKLPYIIRNENKSVSDSLLKAFIKDIGDYFENTYASNIKGFYASNFEEIELLNNVNFKGEIIGDIHLYSYNHISRDVLIKNGITNTTIPFELTQREIIDRNISGEELLIYGRIPMLISSQCIVKTKNKCNYNNTGKCNYIVDRKREKLFCFSDCSTCTNTIFNSVPLSITDEIDFIKRLSPSVLRFDFTCEEGNEIKDILDKFEIALQNDLNDSIKVVTKYTKGHLKKGVL